MAYFDQRELVDLIRHELRVEDESGLTARTIAPAHKRAKYGGLPLNFRTSQSNEDDDEDEDSGGYEIPLYEEPIHTRAIIESRVRSRTVDSENDADMERIRSASINSENLFVPVAQPIDFHNQQPPEVSDITKYILENLSSLQNPLNEFASIESTGRQAKQILILYATDDTAPDDMLRTEISVAVTAKVSQVIGFCCYKYLQITGEELPGSVCDYDLLMADECGDIDTDFPCLERARRIGDLGFPVLALSRTKKRNKQQRDENKKLIVYFPNGDLYEVVVANDDVLLSWVCEETLRLRDQLMNPAGYRPPVLNRRRRSQVDLSLGDQYDEREGDDGLIKIKEYSIEAAEVFDEPFSLDTTVGSTGCTEFVMVRKNSSRGDFHPRPRSSLMSQRQMSTLLSPTTPLPSGRHSAVFDFTSFSRNDPTTPLNISSPSDEGIISCFVVERLHKYKPRWTANLVLRWNVLEVTPFACESERRKSFLPQQYQKATRVAWENVCDAVVAARERTNKEPIHSITIHWLSFSISSSPSTESASASLEDNEEASLGQIVRAGDSCSWKSVQLECRSREDAHEIHRMVHSIMEARESPAYQAWQHSLLGSRRPSSSAETALISHPDGPFAPPITERKRGAKLWHIAKIKQLLTVKPK